MNRITWFLALASLLLQATGGGAEGKTASSVDVPTAIIGQDVMTRLMDSDDPAPVIVRLTRPQTAARDVAGLRRKTAEALQPFIASLTASPNISKIRPLLLQPAFSAEITMHGLEELQSRPELLEIEIDDRWELHTAEGIEVIQADDMQAFGFTGDGFTIGIIDTGIDPHHPTLGSGDIPNAKVIRGLDTADLDDDPSDCSGHGTAVASIAAGLSYQWSPERFFAGGVAPVATIVAYKAASDTNCTALIESSVIAAIEDAVIHRDIDDNQLVALNISGGAGAWPGPCDDAHPAMATAVQQAADAGIAIVASTGNNGLENGVAAPACLQGVLSVGSVWDQDAGEIGSVFCLDFQCQNICSDGSKMAGEVTCYSNSGQMLDLLAPSEYLRVAEASGQTTSFGGTSGAAPYLAGAIAMLRRAYPDLPVADIRTLLAASGDMVTEPRSGLSRPIIKLVDALDSRVINLPDETEVTLPPADHASHVSPLHVSETGEIGGIRVWLRLTHPDPSALEVQLSSPTGTTVDLHAPGTPPETAGGFFGTYPIDLTPFESLDAFIGTERQGAWALTIKDHSNNSTSLGVLNSWGLVIADIESPPTPPTPGTVRLPIAARGPGIAGTEWTTNIRVLNPAVSEPAEVRLFLFGEEISGLESRVQRPLFIPAGATIRIDDVIGDLFSLDAGAGPVLLDSDGHRLVVAGRIATASADGGSYGQFVPSVTRPTASRSVLLQLAGGPDFRTNLGFSEQNGNPATATLTMYDAETGEALGEPVDIYVPPFSVKRMQRVVDRFASPSNRAYAVVQTTEGNLLSWASVVDERTGDAIFVPGEAPAVQNQLMIPVVARNPGLGGTIWRSDLHLLSLSPRNTELTLEFRNSSDPQGVFHSEVVSLIPGQVATFEDVLGEVFSIEEGAGSLRIIVNTPNATLMASSRTFNRTDGGTFGQSIAAESSGFSGPSSIVFVDGSNNTRSNLLLCEVSGDSVWIEISLFDESGNKLGNSLVVQLDPFRLLQVNDVFGAFGVTHRSNCRIQLRPLTGDGTYTGLVSRVDQTTGDAIAIPATATP